MREGVKMSIDSIRVYQSRDGSAHVGANHTVGCDPPEYPTREWIRGHEYRYMRNPPFSYDDDHPLKRVPRGGGECKTDDDCGANIQHENLTEVYEAAFASMTGEESSDHRRTESKGMGRCIPATSMPAMFSAAMDLPDKVCLCNPGFTGPHCHAQDHYEEEISAEELKMMQSPFRYVQKFQATPFMLGIVCVLITLFLGFLVLIVQTKKGEVNGLEAPLESQRPKFAGSEGESLITGASI